MKRSMFLIAVVTAVLTLVLPFVGGSGPSLFGTVAAAHAEQQTSLPVFASAPVVATASTASVELAYVNESLVADQQKARAAELKSDSEHMAQKPVPKPKPAVIQAAIGRATTTTARRAAVAAAGGSCPSAVGGATNGAPGRTSAGGVAGTTSGDLDSFARTYNAIRVSNCLQPVPLSHFRYDSCMETRLFWMAEDPSTNPASA